MLALTGCASAPVQELSDARQALNAARAAGGERYTPETLEQAEQLLSEAAESLSTGKYGAAREAALQAKHYATMARRATLAVTQVD